MKTNKKRKKVLFCTRFPCFLSFKTGNRQKMRCRFHFVNNLKITASEVCFNFCMLLIFRIVLCVSILGTMQIKFDLSVADFRFS